MKLKPRTLMNETAGLEPQFKEFIKRNPSLSEKELVETLKAEWRKVCLMQHIDPETGRPL